MCNLVDVNQCEYEKYFIFSGFEQSALPCRALQVALLPQMLFFNVLMFHSLCGHVLCVFVSNKINIYNVLRGVHVQLFIPSQSEFSLILNTDISIFCYREELLCPLTMKVFRNVKSGKC